MKKVAICIMLAAIVALVGCDKYSDQNLKDIMKGRLFWTYAVDSIMEPWGTVIQSKGTKLSNMRWRIKPDMTAIRYDSKDPYFAGMPEYQRFTVIQDPNTMATFNFGRNRAIIDGVTGYLTIYQMDVPRIYFCHAVPDGDGMNGVE